MNTKREKLEEFERKAMPDSYFETAKSDFREFYSTNHELLQSAEKSLRNLVSLLLQPSTFHPPKVTSRLKSRNECIQKFDGKYRKSFEETGERYRIQDSITDLIGIRVVCLYESDVEEIDRILRSELSLVEKTDKTKLIESSDNEFGYKGIHLDLKLDDRRKSLTENRSFSEQRFEVQIRTIVQDAWSEVDHKLKYKSEIPSSLRRRIHRLAALFELADQEFESVRNKSIEFEDAAKSDDLDEKTTILDIFGFQRVAEPQFEDFNFFGQTLEQLLGQIKNMRKNITVDDFRNILEKNIKRVREYKAYMHSIGNPMGAYTMIRHCFYLSDSETFQGIIFDGHRRNFDRWLETNSVFPHK